MISETFSRWLDSNQCALANALDAVRAALQASIRRSQDETAHDEVPDRPTMAPARITEEGLPPSALDTLCATFALSPFERDILLLCAGIELDAQWAALCAEAQGDPLRSFPSFSLALAALPGAHWSALTPAAPLRRWKLIEIGPGNSLTSSPLRIEERVLHYLTGADYLEDRLANLIEPVMSPEELLPSHRALAAQIVSLWSQAPSGQPLPILQLCGEETMGKHAIAAAACAEMGLRLHRLSIALLPTQPQDFELLMRLWEREAALMRSVLLLDCDCLETEDAARTEGISRVLERMQGPLMIAASERRRPHQRPLLTVEVGKPTTQEQQALWHAALAEKAASLNGHIARLTAHFDVNVQTIRAASLTALGRATIDADAARQAGSETGSADKTDEVLEGALWDSCRLQARPRLDDLAQRAEATATWEDLILPEAQFRLLRAILAHVRQRSTVYQDWGFAARSNRGLGISALFAGDSGTGKTTAAEVLARELRLDLYRIDLSAVVSKYIGETEKNLRRVFDAAQEGGAVLLFDEADALFGKRSEVKDSHDRYANIEVSYLLQRMESYRGLAILTTNLKSALDTAFQRRIRFILHFPFPDAGQREQIWRRMFTPQTPTEGLDMRKLAQLNVTGGTIRNTALNAAFLAAEAGEPVRMAHLLRAARDEYAKLEKTLTEAEVAGWLA